MSLSTNLTLTTEIEAVNVLLSTIGEAPINSLNDTTLPDVATARGALRDVSRWLQTRGWDWNREDDFPLSPDLNGEVALPRNLLKLHISHLRYPSNRFIHRGTRLYDKLNHTYKIPETIMATVVFFLPFEEMNETARQFIVMHGAHLFQKRSVGSETLFGFTAEDRSAAWAALVEEEAEAGDYNILYGSNDNPVRTYDPSGIFKS